MRPLNTLSPDELAELGTEIGDLASTHPDITDKIFAHARDQMVKSGNFISYGFGDILHALRNYWHHVLATPEQRPPIPWSAIQGPSGKGKL